MTIPWALATSGLNPQTISRQHGHGRQFRRHDPVRQSFGAGIARRSTARCSAAVTGVAIDKDGTVTAQFSNGLSQKVFKIPVATFANPDGLAARCRATPMPRPRRPARRPSTRPIPAAPARIQSKALEGSTVDLATEFTNLITTQRAYSASARIITTADQMLQQLEQMPVRNDDADAEKRFEDGLFAHSSKRKLYRLHLPRLLALF